MRYSTRMRGRIGCTLFELGIPAVVLLLLLIHTHTYNGVSLKYFLFDCEWHCCI